MLGNSWLCDKGVKVATQPMTLPEIRSEIKSFKKARVFGVIGVLLTLIGAFISASNGQGAAVVGFVMTAVLFVLVFTYAASKIRGLRRQAGELHRRGQVSR